ncbi:MAG: hypothetical protein ACPL6C_01895 [bacterium]
MIPDLNILGNKWLELKKQGMQNLLQFIVADELKEEGIRGAKIANFEGMEIKIFAPEYLIAILTRTDRKKDIERVERMLEEVKIDKAKLKDVLKRYKTRVKK